MSSPPPEDRKRRPRYPGRNPRRFHEKYKELDPERYAADVEKVLASGKTPAGSHRPILVDEVMRLLAPKAGEVAVDCTLGGGGHARAILERLRPHGRLIGLDVDPIELPRTQARLRAAGFGPDVLQAVRSNFAGLPRILAGEGLAHADMILADLGVSSMQLDNPDRGFTYKESGPLDMRMNPSRGEPAAQLIARLSAAELTRVLEENADEPRAGLIANLLKSAPVATTGELAVRVTGGIRVTEPRATSDDVETSLRRTCQALRIAVNDELGALEALLRILPSCLASAGRVVMLTFHSGEDRRVKHAFAAGRRDGIYTAVADVVVRASAAEVRANLRASSAKLRWAVRA